MAEIGELQKDESGREYRMINNEKVYQIEAKDAHSQRINDAINSRRAYGGNTHDWLMEKSLQNEKI